MRRAFAAAAAALAISAIAPGARADDAAPSRADDAAPSRAADAPPRADDAPPARYPPSSVRPALIGGGLALAGAAYTVTFLSARAWPDVPGSSSMKIPVAGPWIALGHSGCAADDSGCGFKLYFRGFLLVLDGFLQAGGVGIAGEGVFMTTEASRPRAAGLTVRPVPLVTGDASGVGLVGSF